MASLIYSALPVPRRSMAIIKPDASVAESVERMLMDNIGALVVLEGDELLGIVSERDIVRHSVKPDFDINNTKVRDIVYRQVSVMNIKDPVEAAMETITRTKRRHVLVEENNRLVAVLSIGDLLYHLLDDKARVIEHLENYITS